MTGDQPMTIPAYFEDHGAGFPIVFVHAFPLNSCMWTEQVSELSKQFRIITFDLPGMGKGGALLDDLTMETCADRIAELLDHLAIPQCIIVGCSMGGYISMTFLRNYPERVKAIVLSNTRASADTPDARANRRTQAAEIRTIGMDSLIEGMLPKLLSEESIRKNTSLLKRVRIMMEEATPEGAAQLMYAMANREDSTALLVSTVIPVCVIVGQKDVLTPVPEANNIGILAHDAEIHVVMGAGHLTNMEAPDEFNRIIVKFTRRVTTQKK